jgi:hypothetical protein
LLSFWTGCGIVEMQVETIAGRMWCDIRSNPQLVFISCFSMRTTSLIQIESFLCQASPRFPIIFNAWMVQFHVVWRTLTLCLTTWMFRRANKCCFYSRPHLGIEYVPARKTILISSSNQHLLFRRYWMGLHWS